MIDVKTYMQTLKKEYKNKIAQFDAPPTLVIIQVGNNNKHIQDTLKDCEEVGITAHVYYYDDTITEKELIGEIKDLQEFYDGIVIQLPLPSNISQEVVISAIDPVKDVDGMIATSLYDPVIPKGVMDYLRACGYDFVGKDVVVIGRSDLVGKPLARLMTAADATVTLCHSKSKLAPHIYHCDLIATTVGKEKFLNCYPIHVPVIDVFKDEESKGDTFNTENRNIIAAGALRRCALLTNMILAKERSEKSVTGKLDSRS